MIVNVVVDIRCKFFDCKNTGQASKIVFWTDYFDTTDLSRYIYQSHVTKAIWERGNSVPLNGHGELNGWCSEILGWVFKFTEKRLTDNASAETQAIKTL